MLFNRRRQLINPSLLSGAREIQNFSFCTQTDPSRRKIFDYDACINDTASQLPRKQVTFNTSVRVRKMPSRKSLSPEEHARVYYSQEDVEKIQKRVISTIKKMMRGVDVDEDKQGRWCSRGLENKIPENYRFRRARIRRIIDAVLDEQEDQVIEAERRGQLNIVLNDDIISKIYYSQSQCCVAEALMQAKIDEAAALDC